MEAKIHIEHQSSIMSDDDNLCSDNFRAWFNNSRVTDEDGIPKVLFHGSPNGMFDSFDYDATGTTTCMGMLHKVKRHGFFFASDYSFAESFATQSRNRKGTVMAVYLSLQNPLYMLESGLNQEDIEALVEQGIDRRWLQNRAGDPVDTWEQFDGNDGEYLVNAIKNIGFDGVIINEMCCDTKELKETWIAFDQTQIKSVLNPGTWSKQSPRLRDELSMTSIDKNHAIFYKEDHKTHLLNR
jgi:ADP-Ribosyltransferase in polyvalent proteins